MNLRSNFQLTAALAAIDAANSMDPREIPFEGHQRPYELVYSHHMSETLAEFAPDASVPLRIAARAQHLERWAKPRHTYPDDRVGYLKWRSDLKAFHAERLGELLDCIDLTPETVERAQFLVQKKNLKKDPETQILEDVACIVFLRYYAAEFIRHHPDEKVVAILSKTLRKMSPRGITVATDSALPERVRRLLLQAAG